jgi:FkbM family methyltransferase
MQLKKKFYEETGMYIDWDQLKNLPKIDTLIDIGVGENGTEVLYNHFNSQKLILIDPLDESEFFVNNNLSNRDVSFIKKALGSNKEKKIINVESKVNRSTFLNVTDINFENSIDSKREVEVDTLDNVLKEFDQLGNIGIKIDTEGYEFNVILGAEDTLKNTKFVIAEVRHNHQSYKEMYKLHEFISLMHDNGFLLTIIFTAKPFIADLCFCQKKDLENKNNIK